MIDSDECNVEVGSVTEVIIWWTGQWKTMEF